MNILFISPIPIIPYFGGIERVTDILSRELQRRGHCVVFLCYMDKNVLSHNKFSAPQYYISENIDSDELERCRYLKIIERHKITHVVCQACNEHTANFVKYLPKPLQHKTVFTCHIVPFYSDMITRTRIWQTPTHNARQLVFKIVSFVFPCIYKLWFSNDHKKNFEAVFSIAKRICFISDKFYHNVITHIPNAPLEKFTYIYNPNTFDKQENVPTYCEREDAVLWAARVENTPKNIIGFLDTWKIFFQNHKDWKAYVVGDGNDLEYSKRYASKNHIKGIYFEGAQSCMELYYKKCKFFCMTSYWESWGMVVTEAMTFGCVPIAMNNYATLTDIIDDGVNGLICKPTAVEMAKKLNSIATDEEIWLELSNNAKQKAMNFDVSTIAQKWEQLLNGL